MKTCHEHVNSLLAGLVDDDDLQNLGKLPEPDPEVTSQQRCSILTVALDHNLVDFLKSCLLHWNDGKHSSQVFSPL